MFRTADILFDVGIGSSGSKVLSQLYCTVAFVVFPACKKWCLQSEYYFLGFGALSVSPNKNLVTVGLNFCMYGNRNFNLWFLLVFLRETI